MLYDNAGRPRDSLARLPLHHPLANAVQLFRAVPQIGVAFATRAKRIPSTHLDGDSVRCPCGTPTVAPLATVVACEGDCGRLFLRVHDGHARRVPEVRSLHIETATPAA